jgi:hypothetical protein
MNPVNSGSLLDGACPFNRIALTQGDTLVSFGQWAPTALFSFLGILIPVWIDVAERIRTGLDEGGLPL